MDRPKSMKIAWAAVVALVFLPSACAQPDPVLGGPPVGIPRLPDLVPDPPLEVRTELQPDGGTLLLFTSTLVNVGEGDFLVSGTKVFDEWEVNQEIQYTERGVEIVPVDARMVWGGDGHEHWHVGRVVVYWIEALDADGDPIADSERRYDSKVGFCFFDSHHQLPYGRSEFAYDSTGCGELGANTFRMGLSVGWSDVYAFYLPGQEVDISGLPDGFYRLWAEVDTEGWFREESRENNLTWADLELGTIPDGRRLATVVAAGPQPSDY